MSYERASVLVPDLIPTVTTKAFVAPVASTDLHVTEESETHSDLSQAECPSLALRVAWVLEKLDPDIVTVVLLNAQ